jgi:dCTP deaminase
MGYDMRLGSSFMHFDGYDQVFDPKQPPHEARTFQSTQRLSIRPHSYLLGVSIERFCLPNDLFGLVIGKSTYARAGLLVNCTPMEPGWEGYLTIELANLTSHPTWLYPDEGIAQVVFFRASSAVAQAYANRKYQDQPSVPVLGRVP